MKRLLKTTFGVVVAVAIVIGLIALVTRRSLPDNDRRTCSTALPALRDGLLASAIAGQTEHHPGLNGVYAFGDGVDAFVARLSLSMVAQHSIDVRYYIWRNDTSGRLLLQSLYRAADRNVRVRILLDDNNSRDMDRVLLAMDQHPNIEVRLFNPFMQRRFPLTGYLTDFDRLNRRMHNKSFTVDGVASIVGGRNIGDEYFGAGDGVMFADLDVSVVGPVVEQIAKDFDRYWASESSYPAQSIVDTSEPAEPLSLTLSQDEQTQAYIKRMKESDFAVRMLKRDIPVEWTTATLLSDDPAKGLGKASLEQTVLAVIKPLMMGAKQSLTIVSPYFVPTAQGTEMLAAIAKKSVEVTVLTNSLAATDVSIVHAGYAKHRRALLEAGVRLYELKTEATMRPGRMPTLSRASLHAKTFTVDDRYLFVGSFNMDPRSAILNTEMGLLFDCPPMARKVREGIVRHHAESTYSVSVNPSGGLQWTTDRNGKREVFAKEPQTSFVKRFGIGLMSRLPIEHLL